MSAAPRSGMGRSVPLLLAWSGLAWFAVSLVAMHEFGAFGGGGDPIVDVVVHGSGLVVATLGLILERRTQRAEGAR